MRKLKYSYLFIFDYLFVFLGGVFLGVVGLALVSDSKKCPQIDCKLEESLAIKGCELSAFDVNEMLWRCEHREQTCRQKFENCQDILFGRR